MISEGIINTISLEQGVYEDTGPVGFGLFPAPIVGIPSGFAHFRAEPDDKPVESEAIGEPAVLTISSSIPEASILSEPLTLVGEAFIDSDIDLVSIFWVMPPASAAIELPFLLYKLSGVKL